MTALTMSPGLRTALENLLHDESWKAAFHGCLMVNPDISRLHLSRADHFLIRCLSPLERPGLNWMVKLLLKQTRRRRDEQLARLAVHCETLVRVLAHLTRPRDTVADIRQLNCLARLSDHTLWVMLATLSLVPSSERFEAACMQRVTVDELADYWQGAIADLVLRNRLRRPEYQGIIDLHQLLSAVQGHTYNPDPAIVDAWAELAVAHNVDPVSVREMLRLTLPYGTFEVLDEAHRRHTANQNGAA
ncbi:hypothetical protein JNJ66_04735 [Candidatus Saccharibacteria bacterium]|nr:hypothetical protein [Candidatus Saccharibacteria bacterium]